MIENLRNNELIRKSGILPLAAVGASVLTLSGCTVANIANDRSFVFSCPPEAPSPKLKPADYTDLSGPRDKVKLVVSCANEKSGTKVAPTRVGLRTDSFESAAEGERQYKFGVVFGVDIEEEPAVIEPVNFNDSDNPGAAVITIEGMVNFNGPSNPEIISQSR